MKNQIDFTALFKNCRDMVYLPERQIRPVQDMPAKLASLEDRGEKIFLWVDDGTDSEKGWYIVNNEFAEAYPHLKSLAEGYAQDTKRHFDEDDAIRVFFHTHCKEAYRSFTGKELEDRDYRLVAFLARDQFGTLSVQHEMITLILERAVKTKTNVTIST